MRTLFAVCFALLCAQSFAQTDSKAQGRLPYDLEKQHQKFSSTKGTAMIYHGGPVMVGPTSLYVVYYGSFTAAQHNILDTFLANLGGSPAFNVNTEYYDTVGGTNTYIQNALSYAPSTNSYNDNYSMGKNLSGSFVTTLLHNAVSGGHLPSNPNGMYILTVSPDVKLPNNVWCAYHDHSSAIIVGSDVKYAIAADPGGSVLSKCSGNIATYHDTTSPNGDIGMDSVVDSLIHEISETVTDPDINAWYTSNGEEVGDVCNFVYGATQIAPNGSHYNHTWGGLNYLAQEIWSMNTPAGCSQGF